MRAATVIAGLLFAILGCTAPACTSDPPASTSAGGSGGSGGEGGLGSEGGGGEGDGAGTPCNGTPEQWCGYSTYCNAPAGTCPGGGTVGTCAPRPVNCTEEETQIVCACDGQVYINACEANAAASDVGSQEGCEPPENPFACGPVLCPDGTTYCQQVNEYHRCKPLPEGCESSEATCDCLKEVLCNAAPGAPTCEKDAEGHFFVRCEITE